jgi:hypothetical protein
MKRMGVFSILAGLLLILSACNTPSPIPESTLTDQPDLATSTIPLTDEIGIVSIAPPLPSGISIADPLTILVNYNLTIPEGTLQVWFENFTDPGCTSLGYNDSGGTTIAGILQSAVGGTHLVSIDISPLPLLEVAYVGVGVRLWTPDNSTVLIEDMSYQACYAVHPPPVGLEMDTTTIEAIPGATAGTGAISGIVFIDENGNQYFDGSEHGSGTYQMVLADASCASTLGIRLTDETGGYAFLGLPPGTYCIIITYSGGSVSPGYYQRVEVVANNTTAAFFGIQPLAGPPPEVAAGYCGDGVLDGTLGEQCDPPNLTDCTASCQNYTGWCGNGIVDPSLGEQCDPPNVTDCTASCQTYIPWCGNGFVDPGEQCDPPNITDCTASCQIYHPVCGDFRVEFPEECDPPNVDFCTAQCELYLPNCGNSVLDIGEECDPPNTTDCTAMCQSWP